MSSNPTPESLKPKKILRRHGIERVLLRNQFYWDNYRLLGINIFLLFVMILTFCGFIFYQRVTWPKPKYFATTPDGRPIPVIRLADPVYTDSTFILSWGQHAVIAIYSLDYVTWRQTLQGANVYFTPKGFQDFLTALSASTNLEAIKAKSQVVFAEVTGTPKLLRQGLLEKQIAYSWDIQMPVTITYQNSENEIIKQNGMALMRIERASLLRHKEGLAIAQLVLQT